MDSRSGARGINSTGTFQKISKRMRVYAHEGREEVSAATVRTPSIPCCARTTKMIERTRSRDATVQPGTINSEGVVAWAATGTNPISASLAANSTAQPEGVV